MRDDLVADGPVEEITLGPFVIGNMYTPLCKWAVLKGRRLYKFTYDWRRSPYEVRPQPYSSNNVPRCHSPSVPES